MKIMKYADKSIRCYLDCLAEKTPAPGGGSSSAIMGSLGCGLLSMVANLTLSDKGFNGYKERAKKALKRSEYLRRRFTLLIDEDIKAYKRLSAAFKKHGQNTTVFQAAVKSAIIPPSRVCDYSYKAAIIALELAYSGKKAILSDVTAGMYSLDAAFESGFINIDVNLNYVKNKAYVLAKIQSYMSLQRDMKHIKNKVLSVVRERTHALCQL
jgi:methenyltetrahydrofolate cyclohydrolase